MPSTSRCSRSTSGIARPAASAAVDQDAVTAVGEIPAARSRRWQACRARAPKPRSRSSRTALARRQTARELRHLAPVRVRRTENLRGPALRHWPRRTVWRRPDWPTGSACRRPTTAMPAARWSHAAPAADRRRLATGIPNYSSQRDDRQLGCDGSGGQSDDSLNEPLVSPAGDGRSTAWRLWGTMQSRDNLNSAEPPGRLRRWDVAKGDQRFTMGTAVAGSRVTPAKSFAASAGGAGRQQGGGWPFRIAQQGVGP